MFCLGCDSTDGVSDPRDEAPNAVSSAGSSPGIPFGAFAQPLVLYGPTYTGGLLNPEKPEFLLSRLDAIRDAGGRVVLTFPGSSGNYTNPDGTFNFDLWKMRLDRFSGVDFDAYITDGTIVGIYLIDEPNCPSCWGGQGITQEAVEEMAQYSKSLWPTMTTIARVDPTWLNGFSGEYVHLDAGWAQYVVRKGDVNTYLAGNVAAAQSKGLGLVVGLNLLGGGLNQTSLTASQVKNFGSVLLGSPYPCAFISWKYDSAYFSRSDIKSALGFLSKKAKRHPAGSCSQ
ncbi:MAG TPA: hypothetical protein VJ808_05290 [Gemmatimonadales bacterium]|nr:hypothetical protein [Gemmatimonadales bacterium]